MQPQKERLKQRVIIGGKTVWITASSLPKLIQAAADKAALRAQEENHSITVFGPYAEAWFRTYKLPKLKPTTVANYQNVLRKHILPAFSNFPMQDITTQMVQSFFSEKSELSKSSHHLIKVLLSQIFDSAIEDEIIWSNPAKSKRIVCSDKVSVRKSLDEDQYRQIVSSLHKLKPKDKLLLSLLLFTGMRRGEACGLRWKDISLEDRVIHIVNNAVFVGNKTITTTTKTKAGTRSVPISNELLSILKETKELSKELSDQSFFVLTNSESPITESAFDRAWQRVGKTIDLFGATPHILRHTYLTELASAGVDPKTIQAIAGHSDIRVTMNRYVDARNANIVAAANAISFTHKSPVGCDTASTT